MIASLKHPLAEQTYRSLPLGTFDHREPALAFLVYIWEQHNVLSYVVEKWDAYESGINAERNWPPTNAECVNCGNGRVKDHLDLYKIWRVVRRLHNEPYGKV